MKLLLTLSAIFLNLTFIAAQNEKAAITGLWLNQEGNSVIEIYEREDKFYGRVHEILKFPEDKKKDYSIEQLEKGKEKMKGRLVLVELEYRNGQWVNGKIKDPKDNSIKANCSLMLSESNKNLMLKIRKGFFSKTKTWSKYEIE